MSERDAGAAGARDDASGAADGSGSPSRLDGVASATADAASAEAAGADATPTEGASNGRPDPLSPSPADAAETAEGGGSAPSEDTSNGSADRPVPAQKAGPDDGASLPAVSSAETTVGPSAAAVQTTPILAWSAAADGEGEDDLDAFPLPSDARAAELVTVSAAAGREAQSPGTMATLEAEQEHEAMEEPSAEVLSAESPEEAIRRFHRQIGLTPAAPDEVVPTTAEVVAGDGGGADGGSGGDAAAAGGGDDGGRGRGRRFEIVDKPMTIFEHLDELRKRIVWAGLAFVLGVAITFPFIGPILIYATNGAHVIAIQPLEPLYAGLRIAVLGGLILGSPVILYQLIAYVLPALTSKERRILYTYLPATLVLFIIGLAFGLFVFEPLVVKMSREFLKWVAYTPSLSSYVNFLIGYSLPFGLLFELPVVMSIIVRLGLVTPQALIAGRRWAAMGALVVAVMFAPPLDFIVTPSIIFVPLYGLYELSIVVAKRAYRQRLRDQEADGDDGASA